MTLSDLANIGNLVSSVAVLLSVIYLALQVRQGARNQRSLMDRGRSEVVNDWLQFIASPEIAPLVIRGNAGNVPLTPEEHQRYVWCVYPLLLHYEDSFYQHRDGMLGVAQYDSILRQMQDSARSAGIRMVWREVRERFAEDFRAFADTVFAEGTP